MVIDKVKIILNRERNKSCFAYDVAEREVDKCCQFLFKNTNKIKRTQNRMMKFLNKPLTPFENINDLYDL